MFITMKTMDTFIFHIGGPKELQGFTRTLMIIMMQGKADPTQVMMVLSRGIIIIMWLAHRLIGHEILLEGWMLNLIRMMASEDE